MKYYGLDWIGTALGLASIYVLGRRRPVGFHLRILASLAWAGFALLADSAAALVANLAAVALSVQAMRAWKRAGPSAGTR